MNKPLSRQGAFSFYLLAFISFFSCSQHSTEPNPAPGYQIGKNNYTTEVDGITREYIVHVPAMYKANTPTPVVFMLHGATGSGAEKYNNSGWKQLGEDENILTVFPTALVYCYTKSNGVTKTATRWHSYPPVVNFCPGQDLKDDVRFLRQVVTEMEQRFNVDAKRIYMVGFSSGAQMTFRCAVEMGDLLAAVVQSAATHQRDTLFAVQRPLPISFELGNRDQTWFDNGTSWSLSLFDSALTHYGLFRRIIRAHANNFSFDSTYTLSGDTNSVMVATFNALPGTGNRQFNFTFVKGLDHSYPNGVNHPLNGARVHWAWLKQYSLP